MNLKRKKILRKGMIKKRESVEKNKFSREMGLIYISGIFSLLISF
jgi:hypothetical protein